MFKNILFIYSKKVILISFGMLFIKLEIGFFVELILALDFPVRLLCRNRYESDIWLSISNTCLTIYLCIILCITY